MRSFSTFLSTSRRRPPNTRDARFTPVVRLLILVDPPVDCCSFLDHGSRSRSTIATNAPSHAPRCEPPSMPLRTAAANDAPPILSIKTRPRSRSTRFARGEPSGTANRAALARRFDFGRKRTTGNGKYQFPVRAETHNSTGARERKRNRVPLPEPCRAVGNVHRTTIFRTGGNDVGPPRRTSKRDIHVVIDRSGFMSGQKVCGIECRDRHLHIAMETTPVKELVGWHLMTISPPRTRSSRST